MNLTRLTVHLRREYWENSLLLWTLPVTLLIICVLVILMKSQAMVNINMERGEFGTQHSSPQAGQVLDFHTGAKPLADPGAVAVVNGAEPMEVEVAMQDSVSGLHLLMLFVGASWLTGFFYLLNCLYSDRKDNSILFWKSLPFSEFESVMAKIVFAIVGFNGAALLVGWACYWLLLLVEWLVPGMLRVVAPVNGESFIAMLCYPPALIVLGFIRGLPWLGLLLLLSAVAKRSPLMLLVVPLIILLIVERIILPAPVIADWLKWHMPFKVISFKEVPTNIVVYHFWQLLQQPMQLLSGVVVGVGGIGAAIWLREHKFEI
ncbi:hypothetical protein [Halioxenophilus sp. WMMB6]|uniref:hypothetical protein n=1 Tax=Halioxenophilus sp. WMMB6 TaxID=3073815 RepID=UPI00295F4AF7|nr:hypothetical protein [Halioxenophilus sp. WMMB6]